MPDFIRSLTMTLALTALATVGCTTTDTPTNTPPPSDTAEAGSPSSTPKGCHITVSEPLTGEHACEVRRFLAEEEAEDMLIVQVSALGTPVVIDIACHSPPPFVAGTYHMSEPSEIGCGAHIQQVMTPTPPARFFVAPMHEKGAVNVVVDSVDVTSAHGHASGILIEELPNGDEGASLTFDAVF